MAATVGVPPLLSELETRLDLALAKSVPAELSSEHRDAWKRLGPKLKASLLAKLRDVCSAAAGAAASPSPSPGELMEPLDRDLAARVEDLDQEVDELAAQVEKRRVEVPALVENTIKVQLDAQTAYESPNKERAVPNPPDVNAKAERISVLKSIYDEVGTMVDQLSKTLPDRVRATKRLLDSVEAAAAQPVTEAERVLMGRPAACAAPTLAPAAKDSTEELRSAHGVAVGANVLVKRLALAMTDSTMDSRKKLRTQAPN